MANLISTADNADHRQEERPGIKSVTIRSKKRQSGPHSLPMESRRFEVKTREAIQRNLFVTARLPRAAARSLFRMAYDSPQPISWPPERHCRRKTLQTCLRDSPGIATQKGKQHCHQFLMNRFHKEPCLKTEKRVDEHPVRDC